MPDDPEPGEDRRGCDVCRGRPVRALILWNADVDRFRAEVTAGRSGLAVEQQIAGAGAAAAARMLLRPEGVCGEVVTLPDGRCSITEHGGADDPG